MPLSDWYDVYIRILNWVVGHHLPVKVKMDGAVGYGFGSVSEQSVHEVISGIWDAVNRVTDVLILLLFCTKVAVFFLHTASLKFTMQRFYTEGQAAGVREIATRFGSFLSLFPK
jgi:hypothetical protein